MKTFPLTPPKPFTRNFPTQISISRGCLSKNQFLYCTIKIAQQLKSITTPSDDRSDRHHVASTLNFPLGEEIFNISSSTSPTSQPGIEAPAKWWKICHVIFFCLLTFAIIPFTLPLFGGGGVCRPSEGW